MTYDVLIADDHAIIRNGLRKMLQDTSDLVLAGEASTGHEALDRVRQRNWDVLVLDLSMPGRQGVDLIRQIRQERPRLPILVFSMHPEDHYAVRVIRAGANGYLSKECNADFIIPAIRKVAQGGMYISPTVAELLASDMSAQGATAPHLALSNREFEIFLRILHGTSLTAIADALCLSIKTVSTHKTHIMTKLGVSSQVEMVRYAIAHKLVEHTEVETL